MKPLILALVLTASTAVARTADGAELTGGVFAHDLSIGVAVCCYEQGGDVQFGVRSNPIVSLTHFGDLRLYALGSINIEGGVDFAAAGLAWRLHLTDRLYVQPALGGAVQSGDADRVPRPGDRLDLGSRLLFEPELGLGYRLSPQWAAELSYVHLDNLQLAGRQNPGMDDLGVRLVYRTGR